MVLTKADNEDFNDVFRHLDFNGDGRLCREDLQKLYKAMSLESNEFDTEMVEIFRAIDKDADGIVSSDDLKAVCNNLGVPTSQQEMDQIVNDILKSDDEKERAKAGETVPEGCLNFRQFLKLYVSFFGIVRRLSQTFPPVSVASRMPLASSGRRPTFSLPICAAPACHGSSQGDFTFPFA
uniref:EF-hand domain-containing protein n=1 Tax=Chromera velia CCMP2878 TaxID=1169474 RepID=A0A0G4GLR1_9ALVE|eukprot:Cvel_22461.t1-p1 / transcript=Cvel_22461.t1 / gene=Cvel_22461 / organism=Chromera_velia_CCMP2878 / gene_product=Calmodulin, putative / transcript_product=Calmodulin, putative / location=Cvel_scaffold2209:16014-22630(-) / protein_length=179 / sequence_SO=supercontig / SO=protein_coding / is_pseudo=false